MSTLTKMQALFILIMLIGMTWLTIDVFDVIQQDSLQASAAVTWVGILGNGVCSLLRLRKK